MALTEQDEKDLKDGLKTALAGIEALKPVAAKVPELESKIAAKDAEITELKKTQTQLSVNSATQALKTAYPDVPEATISIAMELPAEKREALLKPIQEKATQLKAVTVKSDPTRGWADAGSIEATTDAERLAREADARKRYDEHKKDGNVFGMLEQRGAEIAAHVRRAFARQS